MHPLLFEFHNLLIKVFVDILTAYYHSRIEYPDQKDPDKVGEAGKAEKTEKGENAVQKEKRK